VNIDTIFELNDGESDWWKDAVKKKRKNIVQPPNFYVEYSIQLLSVTKEQVNGNPSKFIFELREAAWHRYLEDESVFHKEAIIFLVENRETPKSILKLLFEDNIAENYFNLKKEDLFKKLIPLVGDYAGRIMPYIYALSLSTTNSRRSRAGKTFEKVIEKLLCIMSVPFSNQALLGSGFYLQHGIGKMVDIIVPSREAYEVNRAHCALLTMKTTLRERWQEVVEELQRTNIPHIFLLTLDKCITPSVAKNLLAYNITIILYDDIKQKRFESADNVKGYLEFFTKELPHYISYWDE
jgi:hypothetical protein